MKSIKNAIFALLIVLFVILLIVDLISVFHTIYFEFTHIHLTRLELLFDPGNHMIYKLPILVATFIVYAFISRKA